MAAAGAGGVAALSSGIGITPKSEGETSVVKTETTQTVMPSDSGGGESAGSTSNSNSTVPTSCSINQFSVKESRISGEGNSSALHWLADLATQKAKDDTKGKWKRLGQSCGFFLSTYTLPIKQPIFFQNPVHFGPL